MTGYLLNATLVWLLSLVCFELFLRKETMHAWNRIYLLGTLVLRFVLPLMTLHFGQPQAGAAAPFRSIIGEAGAFKERLAALPRLAGDAEPAITSGADWLLWLYAGGVAVTFGALLFQVAGIVRLYFTGRKSAFAGTAIVETGQRHGPFSFFHLTFLSDRHRYTAEELALVLGHEQRHSKLLHSLDMIFLQLLRCVLWFHPLMYWYQRRLRLVHEYRADEVARPQAAHYGRFLIEQSLLEPAPSITHSFHQSPLKNRITMLTKMPSSGLRLTRYLLVLPLLLLTVLCCSRYESVAQGRNRAGNRIFYKGNVLELGSRPVPGELLKQAANDPHARSTVDRMQEDSIIVRLNGNKIYQPTEVTQPPVFVGDRTAAQTIIDRAGKALSALPDGRYTFLVVNAVVDEKGALAYYDLTPLMPAFGGIATNPQTGDKLFVMDVTAITDSTGQQIAFGRSASKVIPDFSGANSAIQTALDQGLQFQPAKYQNKPVPVSADDVIGLAMSQDIVVKAGKVSLEKSATAEWQQYNDKIGGKK